MYRFLIMIAIAAVIGFGLVAAAFKPDHSDLQLIAVTFMVIGFALTVFGFVAVTRWEKKGTDFYQNFVAAGLITSATGICVLPLSELKVVTVLVIAGLAFLMALIIPKMNHAKHAGLRALPVFVAMISGPASMWAIVSGWSLLSALFLLVAGVVSAFGLCRLQPIGQAATLDPHAAAARAGKG